MKFVEHGYRPTAEQRRRWLDQAAASMPVLYEVPCTPVGLVTCVADATAW